MPEFCHFFSNRSELELITFRKCETELSPHHCHTHSLPFTILHPDFHYWNLARKTRTFLSYDWELTPRACICIATSLITAQQKEGGVVWQICSLRWLPCIVRLSGNTGPPGPHNTILNKAFTRVWNIYLKKDFIVSQCMHPEWFC